jgi:hypothetical protein
MTTLKTTLRRTPDGAWQSVVLLLPSGETITLDVDSTSTRALRLRWQAPREVLIVREPYVAPTGARAPMATPSPITATAEDLYP